MTEEMYQELLESIRLTDEEIGALCDAADIEDSETADAIIDGAYERLFKNV